MQNNARQQLKGAGILVAIAAVIAFWYVDTHTADTGEYYASYTRDLRTYSLQPYPTKQANAIAKRTCGHRLEDDRQYVQGLHEALNDSDWKTLAFQIAMISKHYCKGDDWVNVTLALVTTDPQLGSMLPR